MTWLPAFKLEQYFSRWEFTAEHNLASSDARPISMRELMTYATDAEYEAFDGLQLGYTETYGAPALLAAIASMYHQVTDNDIITFAGAEEGLFLAFNVLMEPGDHAVVITPCYQSAETVPAAIGEVTAVPLDPDSNWSLDLDQVRAAITPRTRVLYANFPHNPTGTTLTRNDFRALVALCDEHEVYLLSDEVYRGLERSDGAQLPQAADASRIALSLNVVSKSLGLAGLRIGWIACRDRSVIRKLERAKHYTTICNSAPSEVLATIALRNHEELWRVNRELLAQNTRIFGDFFSSRTDLFRWQPPQAGCVAFPQWIGQDSADSMCRDLVDEAGVLLLPPSVFTSAVTATPQDRFRIGIGRPGPEDALGAWADWLVDHNHGKKA